jgi:putative peptidoglycan lipid II flippase
VLKAPDLSPGPENSGEGAGLVKSAGIVSASITISRITGLLRESVLSGLFGAGATYDAYVLGYRIPNLARELFAEGALSFAFVPTFTRYLATKSHEEARELSNITATVLLVIAGSFCALGILLSPWIVDLFAPGFQAVPGKSELATTLVRTMFPFLLLLALAAQAQGVLYATHRFAVPAVSPAIFNLVSVASGLAIGYWLAPRLGFSMAHGMAAGVVVGGVAQLAFLLPAVWRAGFAWRPRWNLKHEGVLHILGLMGPAVIGNASGQINVLVNTNFAAGLRDASGHVMNGPVSWLAYAYRFFVLPLGIFGVAIASAALPRIARSAAHRNFVEFREIMSRSILMILLLTVPASVGLAVLGESMVGIVYQHGKFLASDTHQTALALTCYAAGLAGYSVLKLVAPAFYTLGDSRTPMFVSIAAVLVNGVAAFVMVRVAGFGHAGLALSASIVSTFSSLALLFLLRRKIGGLQGRELMAGLMKIVGAAGVMGLLCQGVVMASHALLGAPSIARAADIVIGVPVGALSFYGMAAALKVPELANARAQVLRKLRRSA